MIPNRTALDWFCLLSAMTVATWLVMPTTTYSQGGQQSIPAPVDIDSLLNKYGVNGSVTILDYKNNRWFFSDSVDARLETLPASTFKIINSCIALETGVIKNEHEIIKWDGEEKTFFGTPVPAWNRDTNLEDAFKNSTVWFYEELAKRIGRNIYKNYLDKANYGNGDLSHESMDFWNYGLFAISPVNQIQFLRDFYEENLPFSNHTHEVVKEIMLSEKTDKYLTRGKTGWTKKDGKDIGWWIGYMEKGNNIFFFATRLMKNIDNENSRFSGSRTEITKAVLEKLSSIETPANLTESQTNQVTMKKDAILKKERTIDADITRVWTVLTNPAHIEQWLGTKAESEWEEGSPITFPFSWNGKDFKDRGEIITFKENTTFSYTYWSSLSGLPDADENYSKITFDLKLNDGSTKLTLTHSNFATETMYEHSDKNWEESLDIIKQMVESE